MIDEPCDKAFSELEGTGRRRWCHRCTQPVHDLAQYSPTERGRLLLRGACMRLVPVLLAIATTDARADPVKPEGPLPVEQPADPIIGAIDKEAFGRPFELASDDLQAAYETAIERRPSLAGKVVVRLTLEEGEVTEVKVEPKNFADAPFEAAIEEVVRSMDFPAVGHQIKLIYPLVFGQKPGSE